VSGACARPLELATLVDYWFEDAEPAEQEHVEQHLMECEECSARLRGLGPHQADPLVVHL
jgi:hypothetical protein